MIEAAESDRTRVRFRVRKRRKNTRRRRAILFGVVGLIVLFGALTLVAAVGIRRQLAEARAAMTQGRAALAAGDVSAAGTAFEQASSGFIRARGSYRNPVLQLLGYVPLIGRSPDAVGAIVEAGSLSATAGERLTTALEGLPGGISALAPRRGRIPLEPLERVAPAIEEGRRLLEGAGAALEEAPDWLVLGAVDTAHDELATELSDARRVVTSAAAITEALPEFLGAGGTRRYFVAAQNPAELRGTGGFIGAFAILTARGGELSLTPFTPIQDLIAHEVNIVAAPNPDYERRYAQYGGAASWQNLNMTADFPSAATAIERLYQQTVGQSVDGVIAADPFTLAGMLQVTEPVTVRGTSTQVDAANVVDYVTHDAYLEITDSERRKFLLGEIASEVFNRFLAGAVDPVAGGRAIAEAAASNHLLLHSTDPEEQAAFEVSGVAGSLPSSDDLLALSGTNAVGTKIDYYLEQDLHYSIRLGADGTGIADTRLRLTNRAPANGQPPYVIGPYDRGYDAGENITILDAFCARSCSLESFRRDGRPSDVGGDTELGQPVFPSVVELPSGQSETLEYGFTIGRAWEGDGGHGVYRLTVRTQPTVRAPSLEVEVRAPEGMEIVGVTEGMSVSGDRAVWRGTAEPEMRFEVRFELPTLSRAWRAVLDLLGRRIVRLD